MPPSAVATDACACLPALQDETLHGCLPSFDCKLIAVIYCVPACRLGDRYFSVSKPSGGSLRMRLSDFKQYMAVQTDEEPLYIFDPQFGNHSPELLNLYSVPDVFDQDFYEVRLCCQLVQSY